VEDPDLRHVPGIIADHDVFSHIRRQGGVAEPQAGDVDAVALHAPRFGHGQEQQVELLQGLRQLGQETSGFPAHLGWLAGLAMRPRVIVADDEAAQAGVEVGERQRGVGRRRGPGRRVAGQRREEEVVDGIEERHSATIGWVSR